MKGLGQLSDKSHYYYVLDYYFNPYNSYLKSYDITIKIPYVQKKYSFQSMEYMVIISLEGEKGDLGLPDL